MNGSPTSAPKIYSLLSIGNRGVGKTVFLAGAYAELHQKQHLSPSQKLWLECAEADAHIAIENILDYVSRTGNYPPATLKISNFDFNLQQRRFGKIATLCQFRWWDTPGESCNIYNPGFLTMMLNCDACCLFIDGEELAKGTDESEVMSKNLHPIESIAEIVSQNNLNYPLALILTKCDRLDRSDPSWGILERRVQSLTSALDTLKVNYKTFYSNIPLVTLSWGTTLQATEAKDSLLWLVDRVTRKARQSADNSISSKLLNLPPLLRNSAILIALGLILVAIGAIATFVGTPEPPKPILREQNK